MPDSAAARQTTRPPSARFTGTSVARCATTATFPGPSRQPGSSWCAAPICHSRIVRIQCRPVTGYAAYLSITRVRCAASRAATRVRRRRKMKRSRQKFHPHAELRALLWRISIHPLEYSLTISRLAGVRRETFPIFLVGNQIADLVCAEGLAASGLRGYRTSRYARSRDRSCDRGRRGTLRCCPDG